MVKKAKKKYRVCKKCRIHHYEDCEACFGFGLRRGENKAVELNHISWVPIAAHEAHDWWWILPKNYKPCLKCGSGPYGVPKEGK